MNGFCPLASGSQGNVIFFGTKNTRFLIDAGLSATAISKRLGEIGVRLEQIEAVLITHEHSDHVKGLASLAVKHKIPVFANSETAKGIIAFLGKVPKLKIFSTGEPFIYGDVEISPFSIQHDTFDPVGFTIKTDKIKVGFCTDLGFVTTLVQYQLTGCDYLYLEANHEPSMVYASNRPSLYKNRVLGRQGHLSNQQCAQLLSEIVHPNLKHVHLAHLSQECNHPSMALDTVQSKLKELGYTIELSIAEQNRISRKILFD